MRSVTQDILTIQSAVMFGAVGNEAALAIYRHHHIRAARLDTVRLAAHPGYGTHFKDITPADSIAALLREFSSLEHFTALKAIQTGYFGHADQIKACADFLHSISSVDNRPFYMLDPVLGDAGRLYVDASIRTQMITSLLPLADMITPNFWELQWLVNHKASNEGEQAVEMAQNLLSRFANIKAILVTSVLCENQISDILVTKTAHHIFSHKHKILKEGGIAGAGDILAALCLVYYLYGQNIEDTCRRASHQLARMLGHEPSPLGIDIEAFYRQ